MGDVAASEAPPIVYGPPTADLLGPPPAQEQRAPSPARTQFEAFVSPFEALTNTSGAKRKPPPPQLHSMQSTAEEFTFPSLTMDPKRKSVENLMEQLTRGPAPQPAPVQQQPLSYDPYATGEDPTQQAEPTQARASRPLPPQPAHAPSPPRASPPKQSAQVRQQQRRSAESPVGPVAYGPAPGSGTGYRNGGSESSRRGSAKNKNISPR